MKRTVLIYPSARPTHVLGAIERAVRTATHKVQIVLGLNGDRGSVPKTANTILIDFGSGFDIPRSFVAATNLAYKVAVEAFDVKPHELVGFWSDDFYPAAGWDVVMLDALEKNPGKPFLYPNDLFYFPKADLVTVPFATRQWWDEKNGKCIWPPMYKRFVCDHDIMLRAYMAGEVQFLRDCVIEHKNPTNGTRPRDGLDNLGAEQAEADRAVFFGNRKPAIEAGRDWVTW